MLMSARIGAVDRVANRKFAEVVVLPLALETALKLYSVFAVSPFNVTECVNTAGLKAVEEP